MADTGAVGTPPVVVGIDGSEHGDRALARAAEEATRAGAPLRVVHAIRVPMATPGFEPVEPNEDTRRAAEELVRDAAAAALRRCPNLSVDARVGYGLPGDALLAAAEGAMLLVAGSRGRGGFGGLLLGSVSRYLAARTECPLLIVRGEPRAGGADVLLGVQGDGDGRAVSAAFEAARDRGLPVHAVHAWSWPGYAGLAGPSEADMRAVAEVHATALEQALTAARERFPDVEVRADSVMADAAATLVEASAGSVLAVVGVRRRRGPLRHWVGHVATTTIEHARCPVLVVPQH
ncbi:universal stress protein [Embleya hyalina]|uniref:Universal stress protein n=1 Tax=Embleya hyalina TaxID=516124 RepID=A0A401YSG5_9ACTN|nr:universal stress protein [Embleya hyalina]GCD97543.1 universal stress protein [Embleya hyalina]